MEFEIDLTVADWHRFNRYVERRKQKDIKGVVGGFRSHLLLLAILIPLFTVLFLYVKTIHWPSVIFTGTVFSVIVILVVLHLHRLQQALAPSPEGPFVGHHHFIIDAGGIHTRGHGYRSFHEWDSVKTVEREKGLIMLFFDTAMAFIFPEDRLSAPDEVFNEIRHYLKTASVPAATQRQDAAKRHA